MSLGARRVNVEEHEAWYASALVDSGIEMYIGEFGGRSVGVCRIEVRAAEVGGVVAINLAPDCRGSGLGLQLLILS